MQARYIIRHHPNLETQVFVAFGDGTERIEQIVTRGLTLLQSEEYCRGGYRNRGVEPRFERTGEHEQTGPWVELSKDQPAPVVAEEVEEPEPQAAGECQPLCRNEGNPHE